MRIISILALLVVASHAQFWAQTIADCGDDECLNFFSICVSGTRADDDGNCGDPPTGEPTGLPTGLQGGDDPCEGCTLPGWVGDDYCDQNGCFECPDFWEGGEVGAGVFDGGDCDGDTSGDTSDTVIPTGNPSGTPTEGPTESQNDPCDGCTLPGWVGDNYCDQQECHDCPEFWEGGEVGAGVFDGGDCDGDSSGTDFSIDPCGEPPACGCNPEFSVQRTGTDENGCETCWCEDIVYSQEDSYSPCPEFEPVCGCNPQFTIYKTGSDEFGCPTCWCEDIVSSDDGVVCPEMVMECADGTFVSPDPANNCEFPDCMDYSWGDDCPNDVMCDCMNDVVNTYDPETGCLVSCECVVVDESSFEDPCFMCNANAEQWNGDNYCDQNCFQCDSYHINGVFDGGDCEDSSSEDIVYSEEDSYSPCPEFEPVCGCNPEYTTHKTGFDEFGCPTCWCEDIQISAEYSDDDEEGAVCDSNMPCVDGMFCNWDNGDSGFCEECLSTEWACHNDGLPEDGAMECASKCEFDDDSSYEPPLKECTPDDCCGSEYWDDHSWYDMNEYVQAQMSVLEFDQYNWESDDASEGSPVMCMYYQDLADEQQEAASSLCLSNDQWDEMISESYDDGDCGGDYSSETDCADVMCAMVMCPDGSQPPVREGECCGDYSLCPVICPEYDCPMENDCEFGTTAGTDANGCFWCGCAEEGSDDESEDVVSSDYWSLESGDDCVIDGACVSSRNYPNAYTNNEECVLTALHSGYLVSQSPFDIETCCDHLTIAGVNVDNSGMANMYIDYYAQLTWTSDSSVTQSGWQICFGSETDYSDGMNYSDDAKYSDDYNYSDDMYYSDDWDTSGACDYNTPCSDGHFCNHDDGFSGSCEPCMYSEYECHNDGLPEAGAYECVAVCVSGDMSYYDYSDNTDYYSDNYDYSNDMYYSDNYYSDYTMECYGSSFYDSYYGTCMCYDTMMGSYYPDTNGYCSGDMTYSDDMYYSDMYYSDNYYSDNYDYSDDMYYSDNYYSDYTMDCYGSSFYDSYYGTCMCYDMMMGSYYPDGNGYCNGDMTYSDDMYSDYYYSESTDGYCSYSEPCSDGHFCNHDDGFSGSCEPCMYSEYECHNDGLPFEGANECVNVCVSGDMSYYDYSDNYDYSDDMYYSDNYYSDYAMECYGSSFYDSYYGTCMCYDMMMGSYYPDANGYCSEDMTYSDDMYYSDDNYYSDNYDYSDDMYYSDTYYSDNYYSDYAMECYGSSFYDSYYGTCMCYDMMMGSYYPDGNGYCNGDMTYSDTYYSDYYYSDNYDYSDDMYYSDDGDNSGTCDYNTPCSDGMFCNHDNGFSGWCEPCMYSEEECHNDGLPEAGAYECVNVCVWGMDMMVSDYDDNVDVGGTECMGFTVEIGVNGGFYAEEGSWYVEETECSGSLLDAPSVECCIPAEGSFTVQCLDSYPDAWNGGYLTIDGQQYCGGTNWSHQTSVNVDFHYGMASGDDNDGYSDFEPWYSYDPWSEDNDWWSNEESSEEDYEQVIEEMSWQLEEHEYRISHLEETLSHLTSSMDSFSNFMSCAASNSYDDYSY